MLKQTNKDKLNQQLDIRILDMRILFDAWNRQEEVTELGTLEEYGLDFEYIAPNTFKDQHRGYYCYRLSSGIPSDEFRFYVDKRFEVSKIEYWYLDWFDSSSRRLTGSELQILTDIYECFFKDSGSVEHLYDQSVHEQLEY
jgi:hypothetical protein